MSVVVENQTWNAEGYARDARFVADLAQPVLDLLDPRPGMRVLDVGCGDGALTEKIVAAGAHVVGVDSSEEMVAAAKSRGLQVSVGDARSLAFDEPFDAVFSNAALHWVHPPEEALMSIGHVLKPSGVFVGEMGGHGCVAAIRVAIYSALAERGVDGAKLDPWFFPTVDQYSPMLQKAGFSIDTIELIQRPTRLKTGMKPWLRTFAGPFFALIDENDREALLDRTVHFLKPVLCDYGGNWTADYVRLRFKCVLECAVDK